MNEIRLIVVFVIVMLCNCFCQSVMLAGSRERERDAVEEAFKKCKDETTYGAVG